MKKLIAIFSVLAITGNVFAQGAGKVSTHDIHFAQQQPASLTKVGPGQLALPAQEQAGSVHVHDIVVTKATQSGSGVVERQVVFAGGNTNEGANNLTKAGVGTLQFMKKGNTIYNVTFNDNAGNTIKLMPEPGATSIIPVGNWQIKADTKTKLFRFYGDVN